MMKKITIIALIVPILVMGQTDWKEQPISVGVGVGIGIGMSGKVKSHRLAFALGLGKAAFDTQRGKRIEPFGIMWGGFVGSRVTEEIRERKRRRRK